MTSILIAKTLSLIGVTAVLIFGSSWIIATCAAVADEKWDKWAAGFLFGGFVAILIFLIIYGSMMFLVV